MTTNCDLRAAFADMKRPDDAAMFTRNLLPRDRRVADEVFLSQSREEISLTQIANDADIIFFMRPEAFVYFLPRLMELCLSEPRQAVNLFDKIEFMFLAERRAASHMDDYHRSLDGLLSANMTCAIRRFLNEFLSRCPEFGPPSGPYWLEQGGS